MMDLIKTNKKLEKNYLQKLVEIKNYQLPLNIKTLKSNEEIVLISFPRLSKFEATDGFCIYIDIDFSLFGQVSNARVYIGKNEINEILSVFFGFTIFDYVEIEIIKEILKIFLYSIEKKIDIKFISTEIEIYKNNKPIDNGIKLIKLDVSFDNEKLTENEIDISNKNSLFIESIDSKKLEDIISDLTKIDEIKDQYINTQCVIDETYLQLDEYENLEIGDIFLIRSVLNDIYPCKLMVNNNYVFKGKINNNEKELFIDIDDTVNDKNSKEDEDDQSRSVNSIKVSTSIEMDINNFDELAKIKPGSRLLLNNKHEGSFILNENGNSFAKGKMVRIKNRDGILITERNK